MAPDLPQGAGRRPVRQARRLMEGATGYSDVVTLGRWSPLPRGAWAV